MVVSRSLPRKSVCTSPTRLKNLSGDGEVAGTEDVLNYLNSQFVYYESMKRKTGNLRTTMRMDTGVEVLPNGQEHNGDTPIH